MTNSLPTILHIDQLAPGVVYKQVHLNDLHYVMRANTNFAITWLDCPTAKGPHLTTSHMRQSLCYGLTAWATTFATPVHYPSPPRTCFFDTYATLIKFRDFYALYSGVGALPTKFTKKQLERFFLRYAHARGYATGRKTVRTHEPAIGRLTRVEPYIYITPVGDALRFTTPPARVGGHEYLSLFSECWRFFPDADVQRTKETPAFFEGLGDDKNIWLVRKDGAIHFGYGSTINGTSMTRLFYALADILDYEVIE